MSIVKTTEQFTNSFRVLTLVDLRLQAVRVAWDTGLPFQNVRRIDEYYDTDGNYVIPPIQVSGWEGHFGTFQVLAASTLVRCITEWYAAHHTNRDSRHMGLAKEDYPESGQLIYGHFKTVRDKLFAHLDKEYAADAYKLIWLMLSPEEQFSFNLLLKVGLQICRQKGAEDIPPPPLMGTRDLSRILGAPSLDTNQRGDLVEFDLFPLNQMVGINDLTNSAFELLVWLKAQR